jgi:methyl-accepting chemotaxis protein-1 (serine sensor receptor)
LKETMLRNLSIRARLIFVLALLSLQLVAIGIYGLSGMAQVNASLKTVYDDRLVALGQLDQVARSLVRAQLQIALAAKAGAPPQLAAVRETLRRERDNWTAYAATYLTPREKELAALFVARRAAFETQAIATTLAALEHGQPELADQLVRATMLPMYDSLRAPLNDLIALQLDVAKAEYEQSQANYGMRRALATGVIALGLLVAGGVGWWLVRAITRPLAHAVSVARSVAAGDLTRDIAVRSNDETGQLLQALRTMNRDLVGIVGEVRSGTDSIATASSQIAAGNLDLSARTEQQAASLEETASSMEQLTATVRQNADNARRANELAASASDVAARGGGVVGQVVSTMDDIKHSSDRIVDIIGVIDGIAFQTNILALNAAVEAARAGEQGRGFAVVATEVRSLAQRSADAARQVKALIGDSLEKVDAGTRLVRQAGATMSDIVASVERVSGIMAEISDASREQTLGIDQINQAVAQMDEVTQQNAALVEQAAAAAQSLQEQAASLLGVVSVFQLTPAAQAPRQGLRPGLHQVALLA